MQTTLDLGNGLTITRVVVGPLHNNVFLVHDGQGHRLLVDAADEPVVIDRMLDGAPLGDVVTTHQHHDHIGALAHVVEETGATPWAGRPDVEAIERQTGVANRPLWTGDHLTLGAYQLDVIGLVGHTPGSIALALHPSDGPVVLFTGDSLFPGGVGKTGTPEAFTSLLDDVTRELFDVFDDQTIVLPGHGESTTLGAERPHLDEWRARGW